MKLVLRTDNFTPTCIHWVNLTRGLKIIGKLKKKSISVSKTFLDISVRISTREALTNMFIAKRRKVSGERTRLSWRVLIVVIHYPRSRDACFKEMRVGYSASRFLLSPHRSVRKLDAAYRKYVAVFCGHLYRDLVIDREKNIEKWN